MSCFDDQVTTSYEVVVTYQICCTSDFRKVFVRFTCDTDDVRSLFFDLSESFCCSRYSLVNDDGFHIRIIGKVYDCLNSCFKFFCEVIWVNSQSNSVFTIKCLESFCTTSVIFRLGYGTSYNTNVIISCSFFFWCCLFCCCFFSRSSFFCFCLYLLDRCCAIIGAAASYKAKCHNQSKNQTKTLFHKCLL